MQTGDEILFTAPGPDFGSIATATTEIVGRPGNALNVYWIVSHFPIGSVVSGPFPQKGSPNRLDFNNYVLISWLPAPGARSYDILFTRDLFLPKQPGNFALATGLTDTEFRDTGQALAIYNVAGILYGAPQHEWIHFNNRDYRKPALEFIPWPIRVSSIFFEDGTEQSSAGGGAGNPAAPDRSVQFNNSGIFGGDGNFIYTPQGFVVVGGILQNPPAVVNIIATGAQNKGINVEHFSNDNAPASWFTWKARGSSLNPFPVLLNDELMYFGWGGFAPPTFVPGGAAQGSIFAQVSDPSGLADLVITTNDGSDISQSGFERLRITAFGRVGISNPTPQFRLDVAGDINITDPGNANGFTYRINGVPIGGGGGANIAVFQNASLIGTRPALDFISSGSVSWGLSDDPARDEIRITATATGGGGGGSQTPWTQNIDAAGFQLSNINQINGADGFRIVNYGFNNRIVWNDAAGIEIDSLLGPLKIVAPSVDSPSITIGAGSTTNFLELDNDLGTQWAFNVNGSAGGAPGSLLFWHRNVDTFPIVISPTDQVVVGDLTPDPGATLTIHGPTYSTVPLVSIKATNTEHAIVGIATTEYSRFAGITTYLGGTPQLEFHSFNGYSQAFINFTGFLQFRTGLNATLQQVAQIDNTGLTVNGNVNIVDPGNASGLTYRINGVPIATSQTPWLTDIDADNHALTEVKSISIWSIYDGQLGIIRQVSGSILSIETTLPYGNQINLESPIILLLGSDTVEISAGHLIFLNLPTTTAGLTAGMVWNNNGVLSIV